MADHTPAERFEAVEGQFLDLQRLAEHRLLSTSPAERRTGDLLLTCGVSGGRLLAFARDLWSYLAERGEKVDARDFVEYVAGELERMQLPLPE